MDNNFKKNKVIIFAHHPAPYRDYFFSNLMKKNIDLLVVYYYDHPRTHKEWKKQSTFDYDSFIFSKKKTFKIPFLGDIHYQLFNYIFRKDAIFVVPGYLPITSFILLTYFYFSKTRFIYSADTIFSNQGTFNKTFKVRIISKLISAADAIWVPGIASEEYHKILTEGRVPIFKGAYFLDPNNLGSDNQSEILLSKKVFIEESFKFLFIGKLIPSRNIKLLCEAFDLLPAHLNATLIVVGDGPQSNIVLDYSKKNRNIVWIKNLTFNEIHYLYRVSDAYIHVGKEPYSLALQEAFWLDVPMIVSNDVGAAADLLVDSVNGLLIESLDSYNVNLKMRQLIENPLDLEVLKNQNTRIKLKFNIDLFVNDFVDYIHHL